MAGLLAVTPPVALALELGEARLRSALGQPLVVEIPYRLAPNEELAAGCIGLVGPRADDALPAYSSVGRIAVTPTQIEIVGATRVLEPLLELTIDVRCPSVPRFVRSYELFVDLPSRLPALVSDDARLAAETPAAAAETAADATSESRNAFSTSRATSASPTPAVASLRASASARARGESGGPVRQGETYLVVSGDTLSGIAARIVDRSVTIREGAEAIFAANPDAFGRGDPNLLMAGRSITIPHLSAEAAPPAAEQRATASDAGPVDATPPPAAPPANEALSSADPVAPPAGPAAVETPAAAVVEPPPIAIEPAPAAIKATAPTVALAEAAETTPEALAPATETASPANAGAASTWWWTALLALGAVAALSVPPFVRRRKPAPPAPKKPTARHTPPPQRAVGPLAGFDVVEGQLPSAPRRAAAPPEPAPAAAVAAIETAPESTALTLGVSLTDPVDIDVGSPVTFDERVDSFGDRHDAAKTPVAQATATEETATIRTAEVDDAANAGRSPPAAQDSSGRPDDAELHTLTLAKLEVLRQDYETEHTLTQAERKALADAVADLEATRTQALRVANSDTVTLELPDAESIETQPTPRLREAR